jgi:hypothetical protein
MPTNREAFFKKHNIPKSESLSVEQVARLSGVPVAALREVYRRGLGAAASNPESLRVKGTFAKNPSLAAVPRTGRLSAPQWAMARIYAFVQKSKGTYYGADKDIAERYRV